MSSIDSTTWQALGLVLTLLGLAISAMVWSRRGPARGLRAVAWSLLPLAAGLTGTLRLGADVVGAVERWAARLVFNPLTWSGIALAGVSAGLFVLSGWLLRRNPAPEKSRGRRRDKRTQPAAARPAAAQPSAAQPSAARTQVTSGKTPGSADTGGADDLDLDEIEQILRRRGIS